MTQGRQQDRRFQPARHFPAIFVLAVAFHAWGVMVPAAQAAADQVRPSVLAGSWYPKDPQELKAQIKDYLVKAAPPQVPGTLVALAVPHAGYPFSGPTAAYAYRLLEDSPVKTVVLVGPSHRESFMGVAVDLRDFETPLGRVPVDRELAERLVEEGAPWITNRPSAHKAEHSLEIQLPFLQTVLKSFSIVPLVMGDQDAETCRKLADLLARLLKGRSAILIASTDLSHFHTGDEAKKLDQKLCQWVKAFDPENLHQDLAAGRIEACGGGPLTTVMMAARLLGANRATELAYTHSGEVTGDQSRVVGYLAAAFSKTGSDAPKDAENDGPVPEQDRALLLKIAREAVEAAVRGQAFQVPQDLPPSLTVPLGAFVTLKKNGELRGCIGRIRGDLPLAEAVARMAKAAALEDPRFPPVTTEELPDLDIELSVLTPLAHVEQVDDIVLGRDGLIMIRGGNQGLLLPQVPGEQGWNKQEFLDYTCRKAGMEPQCWEQGARVFRFQAQVFGEKDHHRPGESKP